MKNTGQKTISILFLIIFGAGLYLSLIFNDNLWVDEAFTASLVRGNWSEVWRDTVADTLPPFYNLFAHFMTIVMGYSAPVMKFASVLPMILSILVAALPFRKRFSLRASALFILLLISVPEMFYYGVEIRPYSWGFFFVTASACSYCYVLKNYSKASFCSLAIFTALSGYAHHFALIASGMLWLWLFIYIIIAKRDHLADFFKGAVLTAVLYLPCFALAIYQIKNAGSYFSMAPLSVHSLLSDMRYPFVTNITVLSALLLLLFIFCLGYSLLKRGPNTFAGSSLIAVFFAVLAFGYAASALKGSSIFTARYLFPSLGAFWMGTALFIDNAISSFPRRFRTCFVSTLLLIIVLTGFCTYRNQFISEYDDSVEEMKAYFDQNLTPEDGYVIYETAHQIETCMKYYYPEFQKHSWKNVDEISGNAWYFEVEGYEKELEKAKDYGYNVVYIKDMAFDRYNFKLYRLVY